MSFEWLNTLPAPEKADAPEPKDRTVPTGKKSMQLPDAVLEKVSTGEWFSQPGLPSGREARAFIYAVRVAAKKITSPDAPEGHGLQVQVDEPKILLKDLTVETPGPITLRMSTANPLDTRRGRGGKVAGGGNVVQPNATPEPTEAEKEKATPLTAEEQALLDELTAPAKSPGAFVDPDAEKDPRDEN